MSPIPVSDPYALVGAVLDGRYRVDRAVARGGFGVVYRGLQLALHKDVAIKVLRVPDDLKSEHAPAVYNLFHLEARTIARLSHPSIVQAIDQGVSAMPDGRTAPWMVLEWLTGHTLREHLREQGGRAWSPHAALALLRPVFDALACAHEGGVAHRDVKPSNIMVVPARHGALTLRLMDFGIAKLMEDGEAAGSGSTRTASEFRPFTERYAAPEQTTGARSGPWTDVHAMGLLMTEMLVGRSPYMARTRPALLAEIMDTERRPTPLRHGVDVGPWEPVLLRALHRLPNERYPHAGDFLAALESTLRGAATTVVLPTPADDVTLPDPACAPVHAPQEIVSEVVPSQVTRIVEAPVVAREVSPSKLPIRVTFWAASLAIVLGGMAFGAQRWLSRVPTLTPRVSSLTPTQRLPLVVPAPDVAQPTLPAPVAVVPAVVAQPEVPSVRPLVPRALPHLVRRPSTVHHEGSFQVQ